ncbi:hypothetical protein WA158_005598 [Blastocystis sp. Blastoise]
MEGRKIPKRSYTLVNVSANLLNEASISKVLGDESTLRESIQNESQQIPFQLHYENPFTPKIMLERKESNALLLKVSSCDISKNASGYEASIVGRIESEYSTDSLSDFIYLPERPLISHIGDSIVPNISLCDHPPESICYVNSRWSVYNKPFLYKFKSRLNEGIVHNTSGMWYVSIDDEIPKEPTSTYLLTQKNLDNSLINRIQSLFNTQPLWTKVELAKQLDITQDILRKYLPSCAYMYSDGPFRQQWVQYNYDPKIHPECWKYQYIDVRISRKPTKEGVRKEDPLPPYMGITINQRNKIPIYLLYNNEDYTDILSTITPQSIFNSVHGYLQENSLRAVADLFKSKLLTFYESLGYNCKGFILNQSKQKYALRTDDTFDISSIPSLPMAPPQPPPITPSSNTLSYIHNNMNTMNPSYIPASQQLQSFELFSSSDDSDNSDDDNDNSDNSDNNNMDNNFIDEDLEDDPNDIDV